MTARDFNNLLPAAPTTRDIEAIEKPKPHRALALHLNPPFPLTPPSSPTALPTTSPRPLPKRQHPFPAIQHHPLYHPPRILPNKIADRPEIRQVINHLSPNAIGWQNSQHPYVFNDIDTLIEDFLLEVDKWKSVH